ncbi:hypothetical protein MAL1_00239 [Bacteriophage DSS3_MAL1]|nr:hypothetical protein MAL1_00239 [Bacteriophage DSS3_MAL1]
MEPLLINTAMKGLFEQKVARTNRKAAKLGMRPVDFVYGETKELPAGQDTIASFMSTDEKGRKVRVALYTEVFLEGEAPVIEGYEFIATVDLRGETPMVKRQPYVAEDVDLSAFFENDGHCDHCGHDRRRHDVLILREVATGKLVQIGRSCAADFFRSKEARAMVAVCDWIDAYGNVTENAERAEPYTSVQRMYEVAAAVVRKFGWVRHQDARYDDALISTRSRVWANLFPLPALVAKFPEDYVTVTDEDKEEAQVVMAWLRSRFLDKAPEDCNDFERNVRAACEGSAEFPMCRDRNLNFLIWGIAGYKRDLQKEAEERRRAAERAKQADASDYVGTVGKREVFELTLQFKRTFGTEYGVKVLQKFVDDADNVVVWWGTNETAERTIVGERYTFKATVKGHEEYEGVKQTCLTRATLIDGNLKEAE